MLLVVRCVVCVVCCVSCVVCGVGVVCVSCFVCCCILCVVCMLFVVVSSCLLFLLCLFVDVLFVVRRVMVDVFVVLIDRSCFAFSSRFVGVCCLLFGGCLFVVWCVLLDV